MTAGRNRSGRFGRCPLRSRQARAPGLAARRPGGRRIGPAPRRAAAHGRIAAGHGHPHARAVVRDDRRQPPVRARLPRRLAAGLRRDAPRPSTRTTTSGRRTFDVPAGDWEYKAPLNDSWDENYGLHAAPDGANIPLSLGAPRVGQVLLRPRDPLGHRQRQLGHRGRARQLPERARLRRRLGPGCLRSWLQDLDGDGTYVFETTALPAGNYEAKVAINESWDENYGQGGVPDGANIPFTVPATAPTVTFTYVASTHVLDRRRPGHGHDDNVEWDGLRHDSRDRSTGRPAARCRPGRRSRSASARSTTTSRASALRLFSVDAGAPVAADDVARRRATSSCYEAGLGGASAATSGASTLPTAAAGQPLVPLRRHRRHRHRLLRRRHGRPRRRPRRRRPTTRSTRAGRSWSTTPASPRRPGRRTPSSTRSSPTASATADTNNDPQDRRRSATTTRSCKLPWGVKPEGYCRNYEDGATNCPWRFDTTPPADSPTKEQPRGRDYYGGDLKGVDQQLDYLASLGVTAIYFNPIFDAGSNHSYDTQDYTKIDPYFGTQKDFEQPRQARRRRSASGSSSTACSTTCRRDSPLFDRYHHYATRRRLRVDELAVSLAGSSSPRSGRQRPVRRCGRSDTGALRGLVRLRLDPRPAQDAGRRCRTTS